MMHGNTKLKLRLTFAKSSEKKVNIFLVAEICMEYWNTERHKILLIYAMKYWNTERHKILLIYAMKYWNTERHKILLIYSMKTTIFGRKREVKFYGSLTHKIVNRILEVKFVY